MTPIKKSQESLLAYLGNGITLDEKRQKLLLTGVSSFNMGKIRWAMYQETHLERKPLR